MSSPAVHVIGRVADLYGAYVTVGTDHDAVTIDGPPSATFAPGQQEEFAQLYVAACHQAKAQAEAEWRAEAHAAVSG